MQPPNLLSSRSWLRWIFEGRYRWGYVSTSTGRYGRESIHFSLYPPESPRVLRRCAHLSRTWPRFTVVGTAVTAPPAVIIADISLLVAGAGPLILLIFVWVALARISAPVTRRIAFISARKSGITPDIEEDFRYSYVLGLFITLRMIEQRFDNGEISWDEYQQIWSTTFDELSTPAS